MAICSSCGAWIFFALTKAGRRMPIDARAVADGNLTVTRSEAGLRCQVATEADEGPRYRSHFATCANARQHRKQHR